MVHKESVKKVGPRGWFKKRRWICASNLHAFVKGNLHIWKFYLNRAIYQSHFFIRKKMWTSASIKIFLLSFTVKLTSPTNHRQSKTCQYAWRLLQRSSAVLDRFFRFPQNNIQLNSCMTLTEIQKEIHTFTTTLFLKIICCRHRKHWVVPIYGCEH